MKRLVPVAALLVACATTHPGPTSTPSSSSAPPSATSRSTDPPTANIGIDHLELRALLLLLADRRTYESFTVDRAMTASAAVRRQLALTLGRIGDARGRASLAVLLADVEPEVRRAAAFALGRIGHAGDVETAATLLRAIAGPDRETAIRAIEGLGRMGVTLEDVEARLAPLPENERLTRLLPALFRFTEPGAITIATRGLVLGDPELFALAVYGLAREPQPAAAALLRPLLAHDDPWIAGWAARALGRIGGRDDLPRLRPLLERDDAGPTIQALRAARGLIARGAAAPDDDWRARLFALLEDPRPGVRLTALETAASWLPDDRLGAALAAIAGGGSPRRARELAILALAEGDDPRALPLVVDLARDGDPVLRVTAARAAGFLAADAILERLAGDDHPAVRATALETRLAAAAPDDSADLARQALLDPDPGVRATALTWLGDQPRLTAAMLEQALTRSARDRLLDARLAAVRALAARARAEPAERQTIVERLERLAEDDRYLLRREAIDALGELGRPRPPLGAIRSGHRDIRIYREIVRRTAEPRWVDLVTERGTLRLRLACPEAPLTCLNFLQLAAQGFYDGLEFHRVVPDFVIQAGDPRGDGRGGPGYELRDEPSLLRYRRGTLGMARGGPDTAGSQFFVALSRQPHLDGDYTAFGAVVAGEEVLDRIVQGDRIMGVVEVGAGAPDPLQP